jgi:hypothetical protein
MRTAAQLAAVRNAYELLTNGAMGSVKEIGPYRGCIGIEASLAAILVFAERLRFDAAPSRGELFCDAPALFIDAYASLMYRHHSILQRGPCWLCINCRGTSIQLIKVTTH